MTRKHRKIGRNRQETERENTQKKERAPETERSHRKIERNPRTERDLRIEKHHQRIERNPKTERVPKIERVRRTERVPGIERIRSQRETRVLQGKKVERTHVIERKRRTEEIAKIERKKVIDPKKERDTIEVEIALKAGIERNALHAQVPNQNNNPHSRYVLLAQTQEIKSYLTVLQKLGMHSMQQLLHRYVKCLLLHCFNQVL